MLKWLILKPIFILLFTTFVNKKRWVSNFFGLACRLDSFQYIYFPHLTTSKFTKNCSLGY